MKSFNIPILNYHKIEPGWDIGITTRHPDQFAADMQRIKEMGFQTVTFRDLANGQISAKIAKPLIITFDDGYESVYTRALPVMREFGFRGVVYIPTAFIGKENNWDVQFGGKIFRHLDEKQLRALHAAGFEIGAHGDTHRAFTILTDAELEGELRNSKKRLEDLLGASVVSVCYPFGQFNGHIAERVREAGYLFALASLYLGEEESRHPFALKRMNVYRFDSIRALKKKVLPKPPRNLMFRDWLIQRGALATVYYHKIFGKRIK